MHSWSLETSGSSSRRSTAFCWAMVAAMACLVCSCGGRKVAPSKGGSSGTAGDSRDALTDGLEELDREACVAECERRLDSAYAAMPGCAEGLDPSTACLSLKIRMSCSSTCDSLAMGRVFDDSAKKAKGFDAPEGTPDSDCARVCGALAVGCGMSCKGSDAVCGQTAVTRQQIGCTVRCEEAAER